jgi:hypothetical protein
MKNNFFWWGGVLCNILTEGVFVTTCLAMRESQFDELGALRQLLFHERQTVTGRNVQVVKFLVFLIGLLFT